jgi:peptidoglycan/LPS O-acetylase OafA/YrhL
VLVAATWGGVRKRVMNMAKQALVAVLAATWIVGLWNQSSWTMAAAYVAISVAMAALIFGFRERPVLKFAPRRTDRKR